MKINEKKYKNYYTYVDKYIPESNIYTYPLYNFIIENVTDREIAILEREDIDWHPSSLNADEIIIEGGKRDADMVLKLLRGYGMHVYLLI